MIGKIIKYIFILIIIVLLVETSIFLYSYVSDYRAEPEKFVQNITIENEEISYASDLQFYPSMRFPKKLISYTISSACTEKKVERINQALDTLERETGILQFQQSNIMPDILISCEETEKEYPEKAHHFIAGEGGPTSIINTSAFYVIEKGEVLLFYEKDVCNSYNVELHELLHVFGFEHSPNEKSIMYEVTSCDQVLTSDIVNELKRLYVINELPDLYFKDISAVKHGIYLDFDIEVRNKGLAESEDVVLMVYAGNSKFDEFKLGKLGYGEGKFLEVKNVKLPSRDVSNLKFTLVTGSELEKENNVISLVLSSS